ncbi:FAD-binding and (Fe-S)-binding domain-containing protein [Hufsiella ginkgonis]|uniref:FAD-binding and (Fe-S)-binding domain-containing protein n=1 Tax=Hufsiella ginkgonis TaxID=2695274 RepID=UPI0034E1FDB3
MSDLVKLLSEVIHSRRIKSRLIDLVSYAADAGFYHLVPKAVVQPVSEKEIAALFIFSANHQVPLTFRTAGTSLSGQSITDGILVDLSQYWEGVHVEAGGGLVRVQPGVIGATVNAHLKKYSRKIGPDPASINTAMMGGILSNNASGMCCGVTRNSYHTLKYIRFILPNGMTYSTENPDDYRRFKTECPDIFLQIGFLRDQVREDASLHALIRNKYQTKNTVGYSVNAFIDHEEPMDILAHLLIGAEGTLGFIAEAVLHTVPDHPHKSTGLLYFETIFDACNAIMPLTAARAEAVELMDRASLRSIEHIHGIPDVLKILPETAAALLVEFQGATMAEVQDKVDSFLGMSNNLAMLNEPVFSNDSAQQAFLWKLRKGMFPAVGAIRASGTTVILEDVAFPVAQLGNAISDLQLLFKKYAYERAIIFGHAKDGNIHFVVTQPFDTSQEIDRYDRFLNEVVLLVVKKYNGALKAEHGTGRNMAPFVQTEWGPDVYRIMKSLKHVIDPQNLLNPGVIINSDAQAHIRNLKALPRVEEEVDKCIECGFCEPKCPSRHLTTTPRRRIVIRRALVKFKEQKKEAKYKELLDQYQYDGLETCAVDGLCATACPVDINTGSLVKRLRRESHSQFANRNALLIARNFGKVEWTVKTALRAGEAINSIFGKNTMHGLTRAAKKIIPAFPLWSNQLKPSGSLRKARKQENPAGEASIVYFPTCISRVMGGSYQGKENLPSAFVRVSGKAGVNAIIPKDVTGTCCGQIYSSKGFSKALEHTSNQTIRKIWKWTLEGKLPVVTDITSCTFQLQGCRPLLTEENKRLFDRLTIIDSVDYVLDHLLPRISVKRKKDKVVLHPVCSLQKAGLEGRFAAIAAELAHEVTIPLHTGCCGMAGDRGFLYPELTASATSREAAEVKQQDFDGYYSSAKTCEMALSDAVGKNYESIIYLLDECS